MLRSLLFIILLLPGILFASSTKTNILVLGDSISAAYGFAHEAGWVNLLADRLAQKKKPFQVINASISGDTTINGLNRLLPLLKKHRPGIVIIELGGNDGLRGLSLKTMKNNLRQMIELCQQYNAKILLAGMKIPPNYGKRYTEAFYKIYQDLRKDYHTSLIPFLLDGVGTKSELMQDDGIHPKAEAQAIIMKTVWNELQYML